MSPYDGRVSRRAVCPFRRGVASSETEMIRPAREAEMIRLPEGRLATLERGGDAGRGRGSRGEPSTEAEMSDPLEGRSATLERGGDCPVGSRGKVNGPHAGLL